MSDVIYRDTEDNRLRWIERLLASRAIEQPLDRITEDGAYQRITEDGAYVRITEGGK